MNNFRYFIYDILNISDEENVKIKEFEYNSTTLVYDFYNKLRNEYVVQNKDKISDYNIIEKIIFFEIIDIVGNIKIDERTLDLFFAEVINSHKDKIYCILPVLPIGGTLAKYKNYKIVIHSNENNHLKFPHVHIYDQVGQNAYVSLIDFEMSDGLYLKGKDKKKIIDYLKKNKEKLVNFYNQVIEHKEIEKVVIDKKL